EAGMGEGRAHVPHGRGVHLRSARSPGRDRRVRAPERDPLRGVPGRTDGLRGGRLPRMPGAAASGRRGGWGTLSRDVPRGSGHGRHPRGLGPLAVTRPTPPLTVRIGSLALRNPVLVASGLIGYGLV